MLIRPGLHNYLGRAALGLTLSLVLFSAAYTQVKTPIIIVPGLTGSELINSKTGEVVWFKTTRSKVDDLRLPFTANLAKNRDNLIARDILRSVKIRLLPRVDVYGGLIDTLVSKAGYHEELWNTPSVKGGDGAIYVYPYDWRLDNVENARILIRKIEQLKTKLKQPGLKFDVIAHSMGGLLARYAAMYGDADLPSGTRKPQPTWAGAKHFDKIVLLGTPNEGSVAALDALVNGYGVGGLKFNLPFVQNISRFDVFTIPSAYQLLPAPGTFRALDENFEPININLYDPKQWTKYGWNTIDDRGFADQFKLAERRAAPAFFAAALDRARRLHEALAVGGSTKAGISINIVGSECRESLDSIVLFQDAKTGNWKTLFKPTGFAKKSGDKVSSDELKKIMFGTGDNIVTKRSLETDTQSRFAGAVSILESVSSKFVCEDHNKLAANTEVQNYLIELLVGKVVGQN